MISTMPVALMLALSIVPRADNYEVDLSLCEIESSDHRPWVATTDDTRSLVQRAEMIVRARAERPVYRQVDKWERRLVGVRFQVLEVIRGRSVPSRMVIGGSLGGHDDFNRQRVPYTSVRGEGLRGSCFAESYRKGREYLLILTSRNGQLTPFWAPLMPTNEQVRGARDPWVKWVRKESELSSRSAPRR